MGLFGAEKEPGQLEDYQVIYLGGHPNYPNAKHGALRLVLFPDRFELKSTLSTRGWFHGITIPYGCVRSVEIVERTIRTVESLLSNGRTDNLRQKNNIHITYVADDGGDLVLRLEMLSGITVMGQAKVCREFEDRLIALRIRDKFLGATPTVQASPQARPCAHCGARITSDAVRCGSCGAPVDQSAQARPPVVAPPAPLAPTAPPAPRLDPEAIEAARAQAREMGQKAAETAKTVVVVALKIFACLFVLALMEGIAFGAPPLGWLIGGGLVAAAAVSLFRPGFRSVLMRIFPKGRRLNAMRGVEALAGLGLIGIALGSAVDPHPKQPAQATSEASAAPSSSAAAPTPAAQAKGAPVPVAVAAVPAQATEKGNVVQASTREAAVVAAPAPQPPPPASTLPQYDVEAHCNNVASVTGAPSQMLLSACHDQEQVAYDRLKEMWDQVPAATRKHCDTVASVAGPGSYELLSACVDQESQAAAQNKQFKFRR